MWCRVEFDGVAVTNPAKVTITKREVTLTTETKLDFVYDGEAHAWPQLEESGSGFVADEGIDLSNWATVTTVEEGEVANSFDYEWLEGTREENYALTIVTGKIAVVQAANAWTVEPSIEGWVYGETAKTPVGEAKFGEVVFSYSPTEVGAAGDYTLTATVAGTANYKGLSKTIAFTIVKRTLEGDGEEPGEGGVPEGGLSKFDVTAVYDGEGHTIDTNRLVAAFAAAMGAGTRVEYGWADGGASAAARGEQDPGETRAKDARAQNGATVWSAVAPVVTNAGEAVVWYRVTNPNYEAFVKAAKVTITPREVTLKSGSGNWVYDGAAHSNATVTAEVSGAGDAALAAGGGPGVVASLPAGGSGRVALLAADAGSGGRVALLAGDAVEVGGFATITGVGEVANAFAWRFAGGTLAANYAVSVETGTLAVTPAALDAGAVFGGVPGAGTEEDPLVCERVFDGEAQGLLLEPDLGGEAYRLLYALAPDGAYSEASPTRRNVADGDLRIWFRLESSNFEPLGGVAVLRIVPKAVTEEMLAYGDDAFFYDGENTKVPDVVLADTNALGTVISISADYVRAYGERLATGEYPVTVTGRNNYTGSATKAFAVLKRPVTPPVIGSLAYNGKTRKATVPSDARWTVVRNDGGVDAGDYPVVLRLTDAEDCRWAGQGEDEADWTGVFTIRRAANGWSVRPGMSGWAYGETPSEPVARARYGEWSVAYRRKGADVASETPERPSLPGTYVARFWVEAQGNYAAVAATEVEFTVARGSYVGGDRTETTPEPVPHAWLDRYLAAYGGGDYEAAGHATGRNGVALWVSYVAGLDPEDPASRFAAEIRIGADGRPVVTWTPDLSGDAEAPRVYTVYGKERLGDAEWTPVAEGNGERMRFFKVGVRMGE